MHVLHVLPYPGQVLVHPGVHPGEVWPVVDMITLYIIQTHNIIKRGFAKISKSITNHGEGPY